MGTEGWCGQCGRPFSERACGPTHAVLADCGPTHAVLAAERAAVEPEPCRACGGSGVGGYVTREMAMDAGERAMEGQAVPCGTCGGDGWVQGEPEREQADG